MTLLLLKINRKLKCRYFRCFLPLDLLFLFFFSLDRCRRREPDEADEADDEDEAELEDDAEDGLDELDERLARLSSRLLGDSAG